MVEGKRLDICPKLKLRYSLFELGPTGLLIDRIKVRADLLCQVQDLSFDCCKSVSNEEHKSSSALTDSRTLPMLPLVGILFDWQ